MSNLLNIDIVSSYLDCPLKCYKITHGCCDIKLDSHHDSLRNDCKLNFETKSNIRSDFSFSCKLKESKIFIGGIFKAKGIQFKLDYVKVIVKDGKCSASPIIVINSNKIPKHTINLSSVIRYLFSVVYNGDIGSVFVLKNNLRLSKVPSIDTVKDIESTIHEVERIVGNKSIKPALKINTHCKICQFQDECKYEAIKDDNLSILPEINDKIIRSYNNRGVFTVNQLSYKFRARKDHQRKDSISYILPMRAYAIREKKVIVNEVVELPNSLVDIYIDIEGVPNENFNYLIGCIIRKENKNYTRYFWAESTSDEINMLMRFVDYICKFKDFTIYHYGSYEMNYFKKMINSLNEKSRVKLARIIDSSFNLLSIFRYNIIFPCYTNSLKHIATHLNYEWKSDIKSGKESITSRMEWNLNKSRNIKLDLILYNNNDCYALMVVSLYIKSVIYDVNNNNATPNKEYITIDDISRKIDFGYAKYIRNGYVNGEIKEVMSYAYFDYLKDRFFVRDRDYNKKKIRNEIIPDDVNFYALVDETKYTRKSRCPYCNSNHVTETGRDLNKTILDLKIENGIVQRWVTKYNTKKYICKDCHFSFIPKSYPASRNRIGNTMKIWMVYQYIYNRMSLSQINKNLRDFYEVYLSSATIFTFKQHVADMFRERVLKDLNELTKGNVLYVDETPFKLVSGTYYCWIFTDGFRCVSVMRKDRKSDFLSELLKGFKGVLVTDFFSGYDSLNCKKQKCLIHFMRDINNDLLKNPFDDDLTKICYVISKTLRNIIDIAEDYGYKKKYPSVKKKEVKNTINTIIKINAKSEVAKKYKSRFIRYQHEFFEFINHNDVLWHNTYAEHSIKLIAKHRNKNIKSFKCNHLADYAVLMSIYQSCHFQGINFLKYMLNHGKHNNKTHSKYDDIAKLLLEITENKE